MVPVSEGKSGHKWAIGDMGVFFSEIVCNYGERESAKITWKTSTNPIPLQMGAIFTGSGAENPAVSLGTGLAGLLILPLSSVGPLPRLLLSASPSLTQYPQKVISA